MNLGSKTIGIFIGTRPELIKLAPVIFELKKTPIYKVLVIFTGQHKELLTTTAKIFGIEPDYSINMNRVQGTLSELTSELIQSCDDVLNKENIDLVIVQGDTSTAMVASLAAFYQEIPVAHIEAGLRTHNLKEPFPEELNRQIISRIANMHFAPTPAAKGNLISEGISNSSIVVTGNTSIDAIHWLIESSAKNIDEAPSANDKESILVTVHRRESWHEHLHSICKAVRHIAQNRPHCTIYIPIHPIHTVEDVFREDLANVPEIKLLQPLPYDEFVTLMLHSQLVMTDSGGVQEDACTLQIPTIILRNFTEREEGLKENCVLMTGTESSKIIDAANLLLDSRKNSKKTNLVDNPFGDGQAAKRIRESINNWFTTSKMALNSLQEFNPTF